MSSQRGNVERSRAQKHKNKTVFKNDRYDTNIRTKRINETQIVNVCAKCKAILEWKIKYKKYKLLKSPRSCNRCHEKRVKQPYHTVCELCARELRICPKCELSKGEANGNESSIRGENELEDDGAESSDSELSSDESDIECSRKLSNITINS